MIEAKIPAVTGVTMFFPWQKVLSYTLLSLLMLTGCSSLNHNLEKKIQFDIDQLDQDGLYGVEDGKRALSYEFCIPENVDFAREVMEIDPSAVIYQSSPGRINCGEGQYLVMGDTFQKEYLETLEKLVNLPYVKEIVQAHFE